MWWRFASSEIPVREGAGRLFNGGGSTDQGFCEVDLRKRGVGAGAGFTSFSSSFAYFSRRRPAI